MIQIRKSTSRKQRAGTGNNSSAISYGIDVLSIPSFPDGERAGTGDNSPVVSDETDVLSIPSTPDGERAGNSLTTLTILDLDRII